MDNRYLNRFIRNALSVSVGLAISGCTFNQISSPQSGVSLDQPGTYDDQSSNLEFARAAFNRGKYGIAIGHLEDELAQRPVSITALNGLGASYDKLSRYDVAQRYYYRALAISPNSSLTLGNIGYSYLLQGRSEEAVRLLELALQHSRNNEAAARNLQLARQQSESDVAESRLIAEQSADAVASPETATVTGDAETTVNNPEAVPVVEPVVAPLSEQAVVSTEAVAVEPEVALAEVEVEAELKEEPMFEPALVSIEPAVSEPVVAPVSEPALASTETAIIELEQALAVVEAELKEEPVVEPALVSIEPAVSEPAVAPVSESALASTESAVIELEQALAVVEVEAELKKEEPVFEPTLVSIESTVTEPVVAPVVEKFEVKIITNIPIPQEKLLVVGTTPVTQVLENPVEQTPQVLDAMSEPVRLEISNGNGMVGLARAASKWMLDEQLNITHVTDAANFDYLQTVIIHRPEFAEFAQAMVEGLPIAGTARVSEELGEDVDVRLVLGRDFANHVVIEDGWMVLPERAPADLHASMSENLRVEVSNGNGISGMAGRLGGFLQRKGGKVVRLTNAESYGYGESVMYFRKGNREAAEGLVAALPMQQILLQETDRLADWVDVRLLIGRDLVPFDVGFSMERTVAQID